MNEDDQPGSLAEQAAAWVPPWQRETIVRPGDAPEDHDSGPEPDDDDRDWQQPETDRLAPAEPEEPDTEDEPEPERPETDRAATGVLSASAQAGDRVPAESDHGIAGDSSSASVRADDEPAVAGFVPADPDDADPADPDDDDEPQRPETDRYQPGEPAEYAPAAQPEPVASEEPVADDEPVASEEAVASGEPVAVGEPSVSRRPDNVIGALEAILLVVDEPVPADVLAEVLDVPLDEMNHTLAEVAAQYASDQRGYDLRRAAGGWRLYTRDEYAAYVERFVLDGQSVRLTQAALETLAVVAYSQPVTRSRMSAIRGVNCDGVVRTLANRGLIEECGTQPESGAFLYRTTPLFLEKLGLDSLDELPPLAPFLPDDVNGLVDA